MAEKKKFDMNDTLHKIAVDLISKYRFKTISGDKHDEIYVYRNGIYEDNGRDIIKIEVQNSMSNLCKNQYVNEIIGKIIRKTTTKREDMGCKDINLICLENGVLNLVTKELLNHSPNYNFMTKIPIIYNKEKKCDVIDKFLNDVIEEEDKKCLQEWFGYQLYRDYTVKKGMILYGDKDTGKTTFINLLIAAIGKQNVSSKSIHQLSQGLFQTFKLYNKHANIADDLSSDDIYDTGVFKRLTGRSPIDAEKKFHDSFEFQNYAKLCFACNKIPLLKKNVDDEAFWDRWLLIKFSNQFDRNDKNTDLNLIDKITNKDELSGLLNWSLEGLDRLLDNRSFSYAKSWEENRNIMLAKDVIYNFVKRHIVEDIGNKISKSDLFDQYDMYCLTNGEAQYYTIFKFGIEMKKHCKYLREVNDGGIAYWKNIKLV